MIGLSSNNFYQLINYAVNFETISEELCENKDTGIVECNGMCYLADQIIEVKNSDDDFTMSHIQLDQWNMNFLFYFFQNVEELTFAELENNFCINNDQDKTLNGFAKLNVPPPEYFS